MHPLADRYMLVTCAPQNQGGFAVAASRVAAVLGLAHSRYSTPTLAANAADAVEVAAAAAQLTADQPNLAVVTSAHSKMEIYATYACPTPFGGPHEQLEALDALLGLATAEGLTLGRPPSKQLIAGLRKLRKSMAPSAPPSSPWRRLMAQLPTDLKAAQDLAKQEVHAPVLDFLLDLQRLMGAQLSHLTPAQVRSESPGAANADAQATQGFPGSQVETEHKKRQPLQASTLLDWQINRAEFSSWHDKIGLLESYQRLPPAALKRVAIGIQSCLTNRDYQGYGVLALITLLCALPPTHALKLPVGQWGPSNNEQDWPFYFDPRGFVVWSVRDFLRSGPQSNHIVIPVPVGMAQIIQQLQRQRPQAANIEALLGVPPEDTDKHQQWMEGYRSFLKKQGDPVHTAQPSRFAYSLAAVYLRETSSDIVAGILSLSFAWTPAAILHYIHLSRQEIQASAVKVYQYLGLGEAVELPDEYAGGGTPLWICREDFAAGWKRLVEAAQQAYQNLIHSSNKDLLESAWGSLASLNALMFCTLTGHRGTRLDRICWGSICSHENLIWIDDKATPNAEASRLLPVTDMLRKVLAWHQHCTTTMVRRLSSYGTIGSSLACFAEGKTTFIKAAFFTIKTRSSSTQLKVQRARIKTREIAHHANKCFGRPANVGRRFFAQELHATKADRWLLRYFTHHSRQGAEVEHEVQELSVFAMAQALGCVLDEIHASLDLQPPKPKPRFALVPGRLPLPRQPLHDLVRWGKDDANTHRDRKFKALSLAAVNLIDDIRRALVDGDGPADWLARLAVHLVVFDGLADEVQLKQILSAPEEHFFLLNRIVLMQLRGQKFQPLQPPTQVVLMTASFNRERGKPDLSFKVVDQWLRERFQRYGWSAKDGTKAFGQLMSSISHWTFLHLPSMLNTAERIHASSLNVDSLLRIAGEQDESKRLPLDLGWENWPSRSRPRKQALDACSSRIHFWGDTSRNLGGEGSRAKGLGADLEAMNPPVDGSPSHAVRTWANHEVALSRSGAKSKIEISTLRTYLSHLTGALEGISPLEDMRLWGHDEWEAFLEDVKGTVPTHGALSEQRSFTAQAVAQRFVAARRFMRAISLNGFPVPAHFLSVDHKQAESRVVHPGCGVWINDHHVQKARSVLQERLGDWPSVLADAENLLQILNGSPLRGAEAGLLHVECVTSDSRCLVIRNTGFSHIKRDASVRLIPLTAEQEEKIRKQATAALRRDANSEFLFVPPPAADVGHVDKLMSMITAVLQHVTGDLQTRVHSLRGNVAARMAYPQWDTVARQIFDLEHGPMASKTWFSYSPKRWTRTAQVSAIAGHGSRTTFISSYFAPWPILRAAALSSTLQSFEPTARFLQRCGLSDAARRQAKTRASKACFDSWLWMLRNLENIQPGFHRLSVIRSKQVIDLPKPVSAIGPPQISAPTVSLKAAYLARRLMGIDSDIAANKMNLPHSVMLQWDALLEREKPAQDLRRRVNSMHSERGALADQRALGEPIATAWLSTCERISPDNVMALAQVLQKSHETQAYWRSATRAGVLVRHALGALPAELALEITFGVRHLDPDVRAELVLLGRVEVATPHRDFGATPRVQVIFSDPRVRTDVSKGRMTALFRVLSKALLIAR